MSDTLWLIGMMGSGKSTVGRLVAERWEASFTDTDDLVVERAGRSISDLWRSAGEEEFRRLESEVVRDLAGRTTSGRRVIAAGGGVILREASADAMRRSGLVVWLDAPVETLLERVGEGLGRPLLADGPERLEEIERTRRGGYRAAAHHRVLTERRSPEEVANEVGELWNAS